MRVLQGDETELNSRQFSTKRLCKLRDAFVVELINTDKKPVQRAVAASFQHGSGATLPLVIPRASRGSF